MENTAELLSQLNRFTRKQLSAEEVYLFEIVLCDNEIDRDGDSFSEEALAELQKRFVGVTGIFDHNPAAGGQTARIFRTELRTDPARKTQAGRDYCWLQATAYMVRTEHNADLIREIDAGIKKEVSISCAVSVQRCSICGANRLKKGCTHIKGREYAGCRCYTVLDGITDVYEWSFVAVPAQKGAGVIKTCGGLHFDAEKRAMQRTLIDMSEQLDRLTAELRREVVRLCYRGGETACAKALADSVMHLNTAELLRLRDSLMLRPEVQNPVRPQLGSGETPASAANGAYRT